MRWASRTFSIEQFDPCISLKKSISSTGCADRIARSTILGSKRHFFDCVRMHDLVFDRKSPFSTHRSDCIRIGQMVTTPDFGFDGVSSSLAEFMSFLFFFQLFFSTFFFVLLYVRNPDTTDNREHRQQTSSAGCVLQPAGYNAIHACRLPAEQEATPHACGSLSALIY